MKPVIEVPAGIMPTDRAALEADGWLVVVNPRCMNVSAVHVAQPSAHASEAVEMPEPDVPPDLVLEAMKKISPIKDKTYEANYAYWEANKEKARLHPEAFAEEIISGMNGE